MKCFTKQLWIDAQQPGDGQDVGRRYEAAFSDAPSHPRLRPLAPTAVAIYRDTSDTEETDGPWEGPCRLAVELAVAEWTRAHWILRYAAIRRILVDFPSESPLFHDPGGGFEEWGDHELSDAGDGFLRHEILFSSGSVVLVEFRDVSVERLERPILPTAP